ncbi:MAG: hypothetical protein O3C20_02130 [Verrucomicrobia bacterium]|nr:hypothetical protein [Verrucomicrobiota bacterium]
MKELLTSLLGVLFVAFGLSAQTEEVFNSPTLNPVVEPAHPWAQPEQQADVPMAPSATPSIEWTQ